ncbi:hypothetical protein LUZ62_021537 [Rhynchospora pubera]|uniref:Poor homologous synapsis 1 PH domain-containing protein n=1 Tax=Rhynchospora pubera TaxID=906938 RepID=A0AAV8GYP1_9POAL|nr:hypothetical protein LUZ62_021537 [Rhynchospora pubera]
MAKTKRKSNDNSYSAARVKISFSPKRNPSTRRSVKGQWQVEYSRFFTVPSGRAPIVRSQPLHKSNRSKGTWLPCNTTASLSVALAPIPGGSTAHVLSLSLGDDLIEEHVLYNLLFSWPQVSCVPECPIRGSRAVFVSFKDSSAQIQKFAVRFSKSSIAEEFLKCVKECSKEMLGMSSGNGLTYDSPESKNVPCKFQYMRKKTREFDETNREDPVAKDHVPEEGAPQSAGYTNYTYTSQQGVDDNTGPLEPLMTCDNIDSLFSDFPPSFTDLLTNCSSSANHAGDIILAGESSSSYQNGFPSVPTGYQTGPANSCSQVVVPKTEMQDSDESDLMAQISKYMTDDNFQAMLFRIEKLIGGVSGGSSLC